MSSEPLRYEGAPSRREHILAELRSHGFMSVVDLADALGVSGMTVRRDLRRLEAAGEVRVVHGGASLSHATMRSTFVARAAAAAEAKHAIAERAVAHVGDQDSVAIDAGTTAFHVATALPESFRGMVVTHSIPVVQHLLTQPDVRLVCLGGELLPESHAFTGPMTVEAAQRLRVSTLFLGATAVDARGVYVEADAERPTKLALMESAARVVLVLDRSKFDAPAPVVLCGLDRLDEVVTDAAPPAAVKTALRGAKVRLTVAS
jgi:DeoR family transcriptional regulator, fructose operon transcriptional repressor